MSDLDLDALEAMEKAATPGPWAQDSHAILGPFTPKGRESIGVVSHGGRPRSLQDAALIASLRNAAPVLIAAARLAKIADRMERATQRVKETRELRDAGELAGKLSAYKSALASYRALAEGRGDR